VTVTSLDAKTALIVIDLQIIDLLERSA